jgi:hypothetical protein
MMARNEVMRAGLWQAAREPINVAMLALSSIGAAAVNSWLLAGAAGATYVVAVLLDLHREDFWRRVLDDLRRKPPALPDPDSLSDSSVRLLSCRLQEACWTLEALAPADPRLVERAVALEKQGARLIETLERVSLYLAQHPLIAAEREAARAQHKVGESMDESVDGHRRWQWRAARGRANTIAALDRERLRLTTRVEAILATLEMVRCQASRPVVDPALYEDVGQGELLAAMEGKGDELPEITS